MEIRIRQRLVNPLNIRIMCCGTGHKFSFAHFKCNPSCQNQAQVVGVIFGIPINSVEERDFIKTHTCKIPNAGLNT